MVKREGYKMSTNVRYAPIEITGQRRELSPFEILVLDLLCEGKSNKLIASELRHSEKVVENTISRAAKVFNIINDKETNIRVLLALAYRTHYGDKAFDRLGIPCHYFSTLDNGMSICSRVIV